VIIMFPTSLCLNAKWRKYSLNSLLKFLWVHRTTNLLSYLSSDILLYHRLTNSRSLVWIGWQVDVVLMLVSISERNMLKAVYAFFVAADVNLPVSLQVVERMASCYVLTWSLTRALCTAPRSSTTALHCLPPLARADVELWRAFFCLLHFNPTSYARSLYSFLPRPPTIFIEYDASLDGYGVGVSSWDPTLESFVLLGYRLHSLCPMTAHDRIVKSIPQFYSDFCWPSD
jgi:hypothetical protein